MLLSERGSIILQVERNQEADGTVLLAPPDRRELGL